MSRAEAAPVLGYANRESFDVVLRRQAGVWPAPVACRIFRRALLWDLGELQAADHRRARVGTATPVPEAARLIACLECGRCFRSLGAHVRTHQLTAGAYRARHGLPAGVVLAADHTAGLRGLAGGPARAREPAGPTRAVLAAAGREDLARAAGHRDWAAAIEATAALSLRAAAGRLGCAVSTVRRWRIRLGHAEGAERGTAPRPRRSRRP